MIVLYQYALDKAFVRVSDRRNSSRVDRVYIRPTGLISSRSWDSLDHFEKLSARRTSFKLTLNTQDVYETKIDTPF